MILKSYIAIQYMFSFFAPQSLHLCVMYSSQVKRKAWLMTGILIQYVQQQTRIKQNKGSKIWANFCLQVRTLEYLQIKKERANQDQMVIKNVSSELKIEDVEW